MRTTWQPLSNETKPLTFLLALTFLFLFSSSSVYGERRDLAQAEVCIGDCMLVKSFENVLDIYFEFDRYDLSDANRQILRDLSDVLKKEDRLKIELQGHCDERGDNNYNIALGQRRAESTKMYLIAQGVNPGRIHTVSYGEERPFCSDSEECRKTNRRVHVRFLK